MKLLGALLASLPALAILGILAGLVLVPHLPLCPRLVSPRLPSSPRLRVVRVPFLERPSQTFYARRTASQQRRRRQQQQPPPCTSDPSTTLTHLSRNTAYHPRRLDKPFHRTGWAHRPWNLRTRLSPPGPTSPPSPGLLPCAPLADFYAQHTSSAATTLHIDPLNCPSLTSVTKKPYHPRRLDEPFRLTGLAYRPCDPRTRLSPHPSSSPPSSSVHTNFIGTATLTSDPDALDTAAPALDAHLNSSQRPATLGPRRSRGVGECFASCSQARLWNP